MSIASEITRLRNAKNSIKTSVAGKGVTIPDNIKLDAYGTYVDKIIAADYSCGTLAYGLSANTGLNGYGNGGLCLQYSEPTDQGAIAAIFTARGWMGSSSCDYLDFYFLKKKPGENPVWSSWSCRYNDQWTTNGLMVYAHKTNKDCFLINRIYRNYTYGSGGRRTGSCEYYRIGIDFSVPCASCICSDYWCVSGDCCGSCNCDHGNPGDDYIYLGTGTSGLASCRGNRPATILCTCIVSSDRNNYVGAAVFK